MCRFNLVKIVVLLGLSTSALALTPLPDQRPQFFSGEWIGLGEMNQFCRINLKDDGSGFLQKRDPSGTWTKQDFKWRNSGQSFVVDEPKTFANLENQSNGTFKLVFDRPNNVCQMQRKADFDQNVKDAHQAMPPALNGIKK